MKEIIKDQMTYFQQRETRRGVLINVLLSKTKSHRIFLNKEVSQIFYLQCFLIVHQDDYWNKIVQYNNKIHDLEIQENSMKKK